MDSPTNIICDESGKLGRQTANLCQSHIDEVFIKGTGEVNLSDNDFIAEGGQGKVYGKGGIAYKIYNDPALMIATQKFTELEAIKSDKVIRPLDILLNPKTNKPIGYTMRLLDNAATTPLAQLFTKSFRNRYGITPDDMLVLVRDMRETYGHVHAAGCLVIDGNELNFKVDNGMTQVYFLDSDSFQTPSYPATYQMESIKDWHTKGFNKETDWFAWGIVTFQMLIGIHPFKGYHKTLGDDMIVRMQKNVSVFGPDVGLPPVVQPFSVIPKSLLEWYKAVFDTGKRIPPPADFTGVVVITTDVRHISGTNNFEIHLVATATSDIAEYLSVGGTRVTMTTDITRQFGQGILHPIVTPKFGRVFYSGIDKGKIRIGSDIGAQVAVSLNAEQMMSYNGRLYYKNGTNVYQLDLHEFGVNKIMPTPKAVANVHENAARLYQGIVIQNLFGTAHVVVFPEVGVSYSLPIKEIKGRVIEAKFDNRIAMVVTTDQQGKYNRHVIRFAKDYKTYEIFDTVNDITYTGLNFVVLDKGICCHINEKSELELFTNGIGNTLKKVVADPMIQSDMQLAKDGDTVMFFKGKELYSLKMK